MFLIYEVWFQVRASQSSFENMEGDGERRQGSSPHDPTLKGTPDSSSTLSSTDQLREDAVGSTEASSAFARPNLAVEVDIGEPPRSIQQRTAPAEQENSVFTASIDYLCGLDFHS